jgi:hypothetical protein
LQLAEGAALRNTSAPPGAHLHYFGGRVVSNIQVVQVLYGMGSYPAPVSGTGTPSIGSFYQGVLNSAYIDWLIEYNTTGQPSPSTNQVIGRGSFSTQVQITPSAPNNGSTITDAQIQAELSAQIQAGTLPAPTQDAQGNNNTYYAIFFPHGKVITLGTASSCSTFCAYHGTVANAGGKGEIYYGVHPDFQAGSGCENGCGAATTQFGNYTQVASHELVETITDAEVGLAMSFGPPLAWYDQGTNNEIGDLCNDQNAHIVGSDGVTYDVQTEFSNSLNDCIVTNPLLVPMKVDAHEETCRGTTTTATVTVFGGGGSRFSGDVTLSLASVSPAPPAGGEITATFDPNPVTAPSPSGSTSTMRILTTSATPAGTYTLTVQGTSTGLTATATTTVVVRADVPAAPTLSSPADNADVVPLTPTFVWSAVDQVTSYTLEIFAGSDCVNQPIRSFTTDKTTLTLQAADTLPSFQSFAWHVTDANACGAATTTSACFHFRTASCTTPADLITNGGFENGLQGWSVDNSTPPPVVSGANPHTGAAAVLLGTVTGTTEPLGDAAISQIVTVPAGASAKLSFWEWPFSNDTVTFDQQYVRVTPISPPGATVVLMNEARKDKTYVLREFDMSQFAGQTVRVTFGVHQDGFTDVTGMYIDDVSLVELNCGPPDFAVKVAAASSAEICAGSAANFTVSVSSVNGPNFTSPVTLSAANLPPGATATFANNPVAPGSSTTLTLQTTRPTVGKQYTFSVSGAAVTPPPDGTRTASVNVTIDANTPNAPEVISPRDGDVNVPRRPTLSWTTPFVPDATVQATLKGAAKRVPFAWELAATQSASPSPAYARITAPASGRANTAGNAMVPFMFGAASYRIQIARDAAFTKIVVDAPTTDSTYTVGVDLDIATQYFWRVTATNACGVSAASSVASFIVGACSEGWLPATAIPVAGGLVQQTVIASPSDNKIYVIGGGTGAGPDLRINQTWAYDPQAGTWTRKSDVPAPGIGANFGAGTELNGQVYLFGGANGPPGPVVAHRFAWRYDIASDTWTRLADLPSDNFGAAVGAIDGKIYIAFGSSFLQQTWQFDPVTGTYARKADAPPVLTAARLHAVILNGELHAFAGGFNGQAHVVYNATTNSWRTAAPMPFAATDPAVGVLGGRAFVVGGRPIARTQIFDPATGSWSQGAPIVGAATGIDNTAGAVLGLKFYLVGGFDGTTSIATQWQLHACSIGGLSSAAYLPLVVDGNGTVPGVSNDRTALVLDNALSGTTLSVSCFLYGTNGTLLGHSLVSVAPNELKSVSDIVRNITGTTTVQNKIGSLALFGTEVFQGLASVANNISADSILEDGQPLTGATSGFVPTVGSPGYVTQTVFSNLASATALVQLVAYPAGGGDSPVAAGLAILPAHGTVSYPDVAAQLGLPATFSGQLAWTSSKPTAVLARNITENKQYSGLAPVWSASDASSTVLVPYVEDTDAFTTALEISNPGAITANVTVSFVDVTDPTGASTGTVTTRDLPVPINYGTPIADVVRWTLRTSPTAATGKRGFVVVTTPQGVTAQARLVDTTSLDPEVPANESTIINGVMPELVRFDPFGFAPVQNAPVVAAQSASRVAIANPGSLPATVKLTPYNQTGAPALPQPFVVTVAPNGQFFSDDLARDMGLPAVFLGSVSIQSSAPVLFYSHRHIGLGGSIVPVRSR